MKMNMTGITAVFLAVTLGFSTACKKEFEDDFAVATLLLAASNLLGGNCATVTKTATNSYSASINGIPRGGCNQGTALGNTRTDGLASLVGQYTRAKAAMDAVTGCTTKSAAVTTRINALTVDNFCGDNPLGLSPGATTACATDAAWDAQLAIYNGTAAGTAPGAGTAGTGSRRYYAVNNGISEGYNSAVTLMNAQGVPASIQTNAHVGSPLTEVAPVQANVFINATGGDATCVTALKATNLGNQLIATVAAAAVSFVYQPGTVTPTLTGTTCVYGSASSPSGANGACPTLTEAF